MTNASAGNFEYEANHLWSGRCYDKANPNRPIAAALVFRYGRNPSGFEVASVWNINAHESYFDYSWPADVRATYVYPNYEPRKNAYYLYLNANTITALRRDRQYLYEAVMNSRHQTIVICEYFIRN